MMVAPMTRMTVMTTVTTTVMTTAMTIQKLILMRVILTIARMMIVRMKTMPTCHSNFLR